jgi:hypothetical protein
VRKIQGLLGLLKETGNSNHSISEETLFPHDKKLSLATKPPGEAF